jgi:hypothetical protein
MSLSYTAAAATGRNCSFAKPNPGEQAARELAGHVQGASSHPWAKVLASGDFHSDSQHFHNILWPSEKNLPRIVVFS